MSTTRTGTIAPGDGEGTLAAGSPASDASDTSQVASDALDDGAPRPTARTPRGRGRRRRLLVVAALLVGALVYLLVEGLGSSLDYFDTVGQALAHKDAIGTTTIRLEGLVVRGTIRRTATGADFEVSGDGHTVVVHNSGSPPQLFQPEIPVVVVGHFAAAGSDLFVSNQIMVKHSATYIAAHPTRVRAPNGSVH